MSVDKLVTDILGERPNVKDRALRELIDARMKKGGLAKKAGGGSVQTAPYGLRETSGMPKGKGYFGELPTANGVMTELSASDDAGDFPLIVPTLTAAELKHLQSGGEPTAEIYAKAKAWAESRKGQGRDPFATSEDLRMPVPQYAKGGAIKSLVKAIGKELPEAKASQKTQIPGTEPTYRKAYDILEREKPGGRTLDYGAGLGHGSRLMGAESFEPFPREGFKPDFIRPEDIPTEEFDRLVNLNVLNVMPREMRDATVENIGRVMRPGGMGIVTTRGRDVLNAAGEAGPEPMSKITSIGTYQKGFTPEELREYLKYMLGEGYDISRLNLGPAGAVVRKKGKAAGGEVRMADGGAIGKNVGRGMAGLRRSRQPLDPKEIQAMMLDVPAGVGIPFAEAGAEYLRGNVEDAETSAAIDAALTAVPVAGALAKPAYRAVKGAVQKAAPAVREAARDVLESGMESGLIQGPSYAVKPTGGQWLSGYKGDPRQIDVSNAPAGTSEDVVQAYKDRLEDAERRALEYTEMSGFEPTQAMTDRVRGLRSDVDRIEQENAVRRWVDSNLNNYVRKQMGTPDDPVLKLAEQGILHMPYRETGMLRSLAAQREKAGFPAEGLATTDLGRMWETMSDRNIASIEAGKLTDPNYLKDLERRAKENDPLFNARPGRINDEPPPAVMTLQEARDLQRFKYMNYPPARANAMEENQWLSRVDPETPIYSLSDPFGGRVSGGDLNFDHIVDVLKEDLVTGRIRPEQLSKMSMEQAVRRTHEYDLERAAAMAKAAEEEAANLSVAKTFDDGFKIVQLDKPGQFAKESDRMGHSVRGYEPPRQSEDWTEASGVEGSPFYGHGGWDAIKSGEAQVFSIRDAKNQPHVTIEVAKPQPTFAEMKGMLEDRGYDENEVIEQLFKRGYLDKSGNPVPDKPMRITQIKGKQNRKPDDDYLPYVQQFIRDGNYVIAGDIRNSGLIDIDTARSWDHGFPDKYVSLRDALPANAPRYVTESELDHVRKTGKFEPKFKEGGAVQKYGKGGVVKSLIKKASEALEKPAKRMSKAEAIERGLYHEIGGGLKLQKPVTEVQVKVEPDPKVRMSPRKVVSPESMQGGVAFPLVGDRAATGKVLKELEGAPMDVRLEGGPEFMIANPGAGWASGKGVLTGLSKRVQEGAESGRDVYGVYTAMGPQAVDFNTMVTEALLNQLDVGALRKADIKAFDQAVRSVKGQGGKPKAPDFPGISHPELKSILMEGPGGQRDAFVKAMAKAQFQNKGFPDVVAARVGVTDPALIDVSRGSTGFTVAKMDPAGTVFEQSGHTTYPFDLAGEYVGGFEQQIPHDIMFYDPVQAKRLLGSTPIGAQKSLEINAPLQYLDQEWLDRVMNYLETQRKLREGFKKGGKVKTKRSALSSLEKAK